MSFRIEVEEGEPIVDALKRLRKLINAEGGLPPHHYKWHKKRYDFSLKPSVYRRRKWWVTKRCRIRGRPTPIAPDQDYQWVEDLFLRPDRAWGEGSKYRRKDRRRAIQLAKLSAFLRHSGSGATGSQG